jgi:hypothetical protein
VVPLVWITGISGAGKSTVCAALKSRGISAVDGDWDGLNHWVDRSTGEQAIDPPYPTPADWGETYEWRIKPELVAALRDSGPGVTYVFGAVANEREVWDLFDVVGCLVIDDDTVRERLATRSTNAFGKHPADLERVLGWNHDQESSYRRFGASIIDGTRPIDEVVEEVLRLGEGLGRTPLIAGTGDRRV